MILIIDSTEKDSLVFMAARGADDFKIKKVNQRYHHSENLLTALDKFLKKEKINLEELDGLAAVVGRGSFTAIRMAVATVNVLGYAFKIPAVSLKKRDIFSADKISLIESAIKSLKKAPKNSLAKPLYDRPPNIT